jgi:hypothetical protein
MYIYYIYIQIKMGEIDDRAEGDLKKRKTLEMILSNNIYNLL